MATPLFQVRVGAEHHELLRLITGRLRDEPGFAAALKALYYGADDSAAPADDKTARPVIIPDDRLAEIERRLAALEAGRGPREASPDPAPAPPAPTSAPRFYPKRGQNKRATPEPQLIEAQRLKDGGMTLAQIVDHMGLTIDANSLKNALWKRRKASRDTP